MWLSHNYTFNSNNCDFTYLNTNTIVILYLVTMTIFHDYEYIIIVTTVHNYAFKLTTVTSYLMIMTSYCTIMTLWLCHDCDFTSHMYAFILFLSHNCDYILHLYICTHNCDLISCAFCAFIFTIMTSISVTLDLKMTISQNSDFTCQLVIETMSHNTLFLTVVSTVLYVSQLWLNFSKWLFYCNCDFTSHNWDLISYLFTRCTVLMVVFVLCYEKVH